MIEYATSTILGLLKHGASEHPDDPAIVATDGSTFLTYAELLCATSILASELEPLGAGSRPVAMLSIPNGPHALVATLASMVAGVCAPMNPAYTHAELSMLADDIKPDLVIVAENEHGASVSLAEERGLPIVRVGVPTTDAASSFDDLSPVDQNDVALLLHTAGTTARPKQVPLRHSNLTAAARNVVGSLGLERGDRCLNVMPLFHSHGLLGASLGSLAGGASIVCTPGMDTRRFIAWARDTESTWYTAAPTIHQLALEAPGEWFGFRFIRSASGPLPPQIARSLEERFGAPLIEVYGMTEAYQIAANPLPPGDRRLGTVGLPTGTEIVLLDEAGASVGHHAVGEIAVRGPAVFSGYSQPVHANAAAFADGWFRTGDLGQLSADGYLSITGRLKEQINRGGEKIAPREVEEALLDHESVAEAMAFAFPHPNLGQDIGIAVVIKPGAQLDPVSVRSYLAERIAAFKVPRHVLLVDHLPRSSTGKFQRIAFAEEHAEELTSTRPGVLDSPPVEGSTIDVLARIWQGILELDTVPGPEANFFDLGGDSLAAMELIVQIEAQLGADLPILDVLDVPALGALAERVEALSVGHGDDRTLRLYRHGGSDTRLVLVPGQYGMAVGLNLIADAVDEDVDVYLFDYPGNRAGQEPLRTIEELAGTLVAEMQLAGVDSNVSIYGNSLGAWVAYEAARELGRLGTPPRLVGIGDMYSPLFQGPESPVRPALQVRLSNRVRRARGTLRRHVASWTAKDVPVAVSRQQAVIRASEAARRSYRIHPYRGDVLVVTAAEREARFGPTLGWERHVEGALHTLTVDANHGNMHRVAAADIGQALSVAMRSA